jgi:hypothetical protein
LPTVHRIHGRRTVYLLSRYHLGRLRFAEFVAVRLEKWITSEIHGFKFIFTAPNSPCPPVFLPTSSSVSYSLHLSSPHLSSPIHGHSHSLLLKNKNWSICGENGFPKTSAAVAWISAVERSQSMQILESIFTCKILKIRYCKIQNIDIKLQNLDINSTKLGEKISFH